MSRSRAFQRGVVCCETLCFIPAAASEPPWVTGAYTCVKGTRDAALRQSGWYRELNLRPCTGAEVYFLGTLKEKNKLEDK